MKIIIEGNADELSTVVSKLGNERTLNNKKPELVYELSRLAAYEERHEIIKKITADYSGNYNLRIKVT